ncbi:MAG: 1-acyl-sn-glycerol-3-phosphate acyltransferase [Gammaproteobacteria bacterium]|nr:1-acyl-sn-glycerol-3-phosphate acyltransferase [Gammaproteobacteria bacterium]
MRAILTLPLRVAFGCYAVVAGLSVTALVLPILVVTPGLRRRRALARVGARLIFGLIGARLRVEGEEHMPRGQAIVVANHASYLDGIILQGALPPDFGFVIKREVTRVPLVHLLLRRIGSQFVDRFSAQGKLRDARRLVRIAANGEALAFFPEGTFGPQPGLRPFKLGAFAAASRAGLPVVPVIISGARQMLPAGSLLPRPGRLHVRVTPPIQPGAMAELDARALLAAARRRILVHLDEPDLERGPDA